MRFPSGQRLDDGALHLDIAARDVLEVRPQVTVRLGQVVEGDYAVTRAGFVLHAAVHEAHPDILAMCHAHTRYGTAFAALGKPLLFGPGMGNFRVIAEDLKARGAAIEVADTAALGAAAVSLLPNAARRAAEFLQPLVSECRRYDM